MKPQIRLGRLLVAGVAAVAVASQLTAVAQAGPPEPTVPPKIAVEAGHKLFLVGHAVGVQNYKCNATAGGFGWGPAVPQASLYDDKGKLIATHFGGPTWQATDGSMVVGQRVDGVTVDPTAIPWLLLSAKGTPGADGDRLAGTTFIQRIATTGGLMPPAEECNAGTVGTENAVPYTADYYFWKASVA